MWWRTRTSNEFTEAGCGGRKETGWKEVDEEEGWRRRQPMDASKLQERGSTQSHLPQCHLPTFALVT